LATLVSIYRVVGAVLVFGALRSLNCHGLLCLNGIQSVDLENTNSIQDHIPL